MQLISYYGICAYRPHNGEILKNYSLYCAVYILNIQTSPLLTCRNATFVVIDKLVL